MADLSYISCPNTAYIRYMSIPDVLQERTNEALEKKICVQRLEGEGGGRWSLTYAELLNRATYIAKYLSARGIVPGNCVAIFGPNSIEWIVGEFAIFLTGAVAVQVYKTSESFAETTKLLKTTQNKALLLDPESDETYISDIEAYFTSEEAPQGKPIVMLLRYTDSRRRGSVIAFIFTTSGSTGFSKMAEMTRLSILNASFTAVIVTASKCYTIEVVDQISGAQFVVLLHI